VAGGGSVVAVVVSALVILLGLAFLSSLLDILGLL
jgi:hypothetical protein